MNFKAVIFDLDDTLFDCSGQLVKSARKRAAKALIESGLPLTVLQAVKLQEKILKKDPAADVPDKICSMYRLPDKMLAIEAAHKAYNSDDVGKIRPFNDAVSTLKELRRLGLKIAIVSSGIHSRQLKKIDALKIKPLIDFIAIHDIEKGVRKDESFKKVLRRFNAKPEDILSVGDRPHSEIKICNSLGMSTARILKGRFTKLRPLNELQEADFTVKNLGELIPIIKSGSVKGNGKSLKIVAIGGGTGLPTVLQGMKNLTENLSAIVTVTDSGRSSGKLRKGLGILPPGDIRNCLVALSTQEKFLLDLLNYRFDKGELEGHSFGNLFIAVLAQTTGSFEKAVKKASEILRIKGTVLPSTLQNTHICAKFFDGKIICEEFNLRTYGKSRIKRVFLKPSNAKALPEVVKAIEEADLIVLGPGSLYTSVISNLLVKGIPEAIRKSSAKKVYVCNIMTQQGQTDNFTASMHVRVLQQYLGKGALDFILLNSERPSKKVLSLYRKENAVLVKNDLNKVRKLGVKPIAAKLLEKAPEKKELWQKKYLLRHDSEKLAKALIELG